MEKQEKIHEDTLHQKDMSHAHGNQWQVEPSAEFVRKSDLTSVLATATQSLSFFYRSRQCAIKEIGWVDGNMLLMILYIISRSFLSFYPSATEDLIWHFSGVFDDIWGILGWCDKDWCLPKSSAHCWTFCRLQVCTSLRKFEIQKQQVYRYVLIGIPFPNCSILMHLRSM